MHEAIINTYPILLDTEWQPPLLLVAEPVLHLLDVCLAS